MAKKKAPMLPGNVGMFQSKRRLRQKLVEAVRGLARRGLPVHVAQDVLDFVVNIDPDVSMDYARLPVQPTGFFVRLSDIAAYKGKTRNLILLRMISMASMYYWLYFKIEDDQDKRSAYQYIKWMNEYKNEFQLYGTESKGYYLADPRATKGEGKDRIIPQPPTWIFEGTTV